jgi:thymidylate kinase
MSLRAAIHLNMRASPTNRETMLVSFSGIDGAGKSTQIANLRARMEDAGLRVELIAFWDDVAKLKRIREGAAYKLFQGDKGIGRPEAPIRRRDKNVRSPMMTIVRLALYFVDALSLRKIAGNALRSKADVVIFDRYLYDELANLDSSAQVYRRWIMKLVPKPQISFFLDADPAHAYARKPEYPIEFLYASRKSYLNLSQSLPNMIVVPPLPLEVAKAEVLKAFFERALFFEEHHS